VESDSDNRDPPNIADPRKDCGCGSLTKWGQLYYIILFSPLSPFHWPPNTWPWMTLNGLNGHLTLNVHYYKLPLSNYLLLIYCSLFTLHMWPAEKCGKRSSEQWSAEYLASAEKLHPEIRKGSPQARALNESAVG